ncbi:hypothetical protein [Nocardiopsis halophila]|uniref:hypothetical protein n=1 Tax=Nocardiopsis halophila TaxID=141692 RepID=UPI000348D904|nr:hypothetical protein [Nocardiopsis halophila]
MTNLRTKLDGFMAKRREGKKDKGAGFIEYGAIILLVAAIAAAVWQFDLGARVTGLFESGIQQVEDTTGAGSEETPECDEGQVWSEEEEACVDA